MQAGALGKGVGHPLYQQASVFESSKKEDSLKTIANSTLSIVPDATQSCSMKEREVKDLRKSSQEAGDLQEFIEVPDLEVGIAHLMIEDCKKEVSYKNLYDFALDIANFTKSLESRIDCIVAIGGHYARTGDTEEARKIFQRARETILSELKMSSKLEIPLKRDRLILLARAHTHIGDIQGALDTFSCIKAIMDPRSEFATIEVLLEIAMVQFKQNRREEAETTLLKALILANKMQNIIDKIDMQSAMAIVLFKIDQKPVAEALLSTIKRSLSFYKDDPSLYRLEEEVHMLCSIAVAEFHINGKEKMQKVFEEARSLSLTQDSDVQIRLLAEIKQHEERVEQIQEKTIEQDAELFFQMLPPLLEDESSAEEIENLMKMGLKNTAEEFACSLSNRAHQIAGLRQILMAEKENIQEVKRLIDIIKNLYPLRAVEILLEMIPLPQVI